MEDYLRKLDDPELDMKSKLNYKDHFELIYIRHRYFRKSTNPTPARLAQFEEMICNMSERVYFKNILTLKICGFEKEDFVNIGRIHAVSFLSMGGLAENPDLMEKFLIAHKKLKGEDSTPNEEDVFLREAYNLASFLRQRLPEVVMFCKRKNNNIRGTNAKKGFYIGDPDRNPNDYDLHTSPEVFGYSPITEIDWKKICKETNNKGNLAFLHEGQMIRAVYLDGSFLTVNDIEQTGLDPRRSSFCRTPLENVLIKEGYGNGSIEEYEDGEDK